MSGNKNETQCTVSNGKLLLTTAHMNVQDDGSAWIRQKNGLNCLLEWAQNNNAPIIMAEDVNSEKTGSKRHWAFLSKDQYYSRLSQNSLQNHWYECILAHRRRYSYFDLESYKETNDSLFNKFFYFFKTFNLNRDKTWDETLVTRINCVDPKQKKASVHVIDYNIILDNLANHLEYLENFISFLLDNLTRNNIEDIISIDLSVYGKNQMMRMPGNCKLGSKRVLDKVCNKDSEWITDYDGLDNETAQVTVQATPNSKIPPALKKIKNIQYKLNRGTMSLDQVFTNLGEKKHSIKTVQTPLKTLIQTQEPPDDDYDLEYITKILSLLNENRAYDYNEWVRVGMALHHVCHGNRDGLKLYMDFSRQCKEKFSEESATDKYNSFDYSKAHSLTMGSLIHMAMQDNPGGYKKLNEGPCCHKPFDYNTKYLFRDFAEELCQPQWNLNYPGVADLYQLFREKGATTMAVCTGNESVQIWIKNNTKDVSQQRYVNITLTDLEGFVINGYVENSKNKGKKTIEKCIPLKKYLIENLYPANLLPRYNVAIMEPYAFNSSQPTTASVQVNFNLFAGWPHPYIPEEERDEDVLADCEILIEMAAPGYTDYVKKRHAFFLKHPDQPCKVLAVYYGKKQICKSTMLRFTAAMYNKINALITSNYDSVFGKNNGIIVGKTYVGLEDMDQYKHADSGKMKNFYTETEKTINIKFVRMFSIEQPINGDASTNYLNAFSDMEQREVIFKCVDYPMDDDYKVRINEIINNPRKMAMYMSQVVDDYPNVSLSDITDFPITDVMKFKSDTVNTLPLAFLYELKNGTYDGHTLCGDVSIDSMFTVFKDWADKRNEKNVNKYSFKKFKKEIFPDHIQMDKEEKNFDMNSISIEKKLKQDTRRLKDVIIEQLNKLEPDENIQSDEMGYYSLDDMTKHLKKYEIQISNKSLGRFLMGSTEWTKRKTNERAYYKKK